MLSETASVVQDWIPSESFPQSSKLFTPVRKKITCGRRRCKHARVRLLREQGFCWGGVVTVVAVGLWCMLNPRILRECIQSRRPYSFAPLTRLPFYNLYAFLRAPAYPYIVSPANANSIRRTLDRPCCDDRGVLPCRRCSDRDCLHDWEVTIIESDP